MSIQTDAVELLKLCRENDILYHLQQIRDEGYLDDINPMDWTRLREILENEIGGT